MDPSEKPPSFLIVTTPKFSLGQLTATPNALAKLVHQDINAALNRHASGDWGELDEHDRKENERALVQGTRLFSAYTSRDKVRFWIITEWDRSLTTILLPQDY